MDSNGNEVYIQKYRVTIVFIVYITLVLDNVLLTVVGKYIYYLIEKKND